jgi:putative transposase
VTKYRHPVFTTIHLDPMEATIRADFGCELVEFNGATEHVHLLVNLPPTVARSRLVNSPKGVSSRRLRQKFPDLARHYWPARRLWSGSYFAGSVGGALLHVLRAYIEQQHRPHDPIHLRPEGQNPLAKASAAWASVSPGWSLPLGNDQSS